MISEGTGREKLGARLSTELPVSAAMGLHITCPADFFNIALFGLLPRAVLP